MRKLDDSLKRQQVCVKLAPWVADWLRNGQPYPMAQVIEHALIATYKLQSPLGFLKGNDDDVR